MRQYHQRLQNKDRPTVFEDIERAVARQLYRERTGQWGEDVPIEDRRGYEDLERVIAEVAASSNGRM